jgi:phage-related tail protein
MSAVPALTVSSERESLAAAISRHDGAKARLARINAAAEQVSVWTAVEAVEKAEATLKEARARAPKMLVARLLGDPTSGPTVEEAEQALSDARAALESAQQTRDALDGQRRVAESSIANAHRSVREAVRLVVQAEGAAEPVLAQYIEARREVARLHEVLSLFSSRNCLPAYWDSVVYFPPMDADLPWREAFAQLESDADATLPD